MVTYHRRRAVITNPAANHFHSYHHHQRHHLRWRLPTRHHPHHGPTTITTFCSQTLYPRQICLWFTAPLIHLWLMALYKCIYLLTLIWSKPASGTLLQSGCSSVTLKYSAVNAWTWSIRLLLPDHAWQPGIRLGLQSSNDRWTSNRHSASPTGHTLSGWARVDNASSTICIGSPTRVPTVFLEKIPGLFEDHLNVFFQDVLYCTCTTESTVPVVIHGQHTWPSSL